MDWRRKQTIKGEEHKPFNSKIEATEISITPMRDIKSNKGEDTNSIENSISNKRRNVNELFNNDESEEVKYESNKEDVNEKYEVGNKLARFMTKGYAHKRYEEKCADDNYKDYHNYQSSLKKEDSAGGKQSKVFKTYGEFLATMNLGDDVMRGRMQPNIAHTLIKEDQELLKDEALRQEKNRLEAKERQKKREMDELKRKAKQKEEKLRHNFIIRRLQNLYKKLVLRKNLNTIHKIAMKVRTRRIAGEKIADTMYQWYEKKKQRKLLQKYINHCASIIQNQYRNYRRAKLLHNRYPYSNPKSYGRVEYEKKHNNINDSYEIKRDDKYQRKNSQESIYEDMYIGMAEEPAAQQLPAKIDTKSTTIQHTNTRMIQVDDRPIKSLGQSKYNIEEALAQDNVNQETTKKVPKKHSFLKRKDNNDAKKVTKQPKKSDSPVVGERMKSTVKVPAKQILSPKLTFEADDDSSKDENTITNLVRITTKKESLDDRPIKHLGNKQYDIEEALAEEVDYIPNENKAAKKKEFLRRKEVYDPKKGIKVPKKRSNSPPVETKRGRSRAPHTKLSNPLVGGVSRRVLSSDIRSREQKESKSNQLKRASTKKLARKNTAPRIDCWNQAKSTKKTPTKTRKANIYPQHTKKQIAPQLEERQSTEELIKAFLEYHGENQSKG